MKLATREKFTSSARKKRREGAETRSTGTVLVVEGLKKTYTLRDAGNLGVQLKGLQDELMLGKGRRERRKTRGKTSLARRSLRLMRPELGFHSLFWASYLLLSGKWAGGAFTRTRVTATSVTGCFRRIAIPKARFIAFKLRSLSLVYVHIPVAFSAMIHS